MLYEPVGPALYTQAQQLTHSSLQRGVAQRRTNQCTVTGSTNLWVSWHSAAGALSVVTLGLKLDSSRHIVVGKQNLLYRIKSLNLM